MATQTSFIFTVPLTPSKLTVGSTSLPKHHVYRTSLNQTTPHPLFQLWAPPENIAKGT